MVFHWSLNDSKSRQVSRTILSNLADLSSVVFWMVYSHPLISKSSSPFIKLLVSEPRAPITIGINVTFMFHRFFNSLARSRVRLKTKEANDIPQLLLLLLIRNYILRISSEYMNEYPCIFRLKCMALSQCKKKK